MDEEEPQFDWNPEEYEPEEKNEEGQVVEVQKVKTSQPADDGTPSLEDIITPCVLVNRDKLRRNIDEMAERAEKLGVQLRPHMKTHKCLEIGALQTNGTKRCIAVSTVAEAEFFADDGFDDIHCTALFTEDKMPRMQKLGERLERFLVMCDSDYHIDLLNNNPLTDKPWVALLKVDVGGKRGGVLWDGDKGIELSRKMTVSKAIEFEGLYAHEGHSYEMRGQKSVKELGAESAKKILQLAKRIRGAGVACNTVGLGSTPTASRTSAPMKRLTELHPGNYVYYDAAQTIIGSTDLDKIAIKVATRVIGHYPHRNQLLIDAGFTALSHDGKGCLDGASYCFFEGHPNLRLQVMHQEIGFVEPKTGKLDYKAYPIGSLLYILPYHSCSTAVMHEYVWVCSDDTIVARWRMGARGIWSAAKATSELQPFFRKSVDENASDLAVMSRKDDFEEEDEVFDRGLEQQDNWDDDIWPQDTPAADDAEEAEQVQEMESFLRTVITPCLMLNKDQMQANIDRMATRAESMEIKLRPHMKTHKCLGVGKMQTNGTKRCIAVSTIAEAEFFADGNFDDIHCTALFTRDKIPRMLRLGQRLQRFLVMCDSDYHIDLLVDNALNGKRWGALLKVDIGAKRGGVVWDSTEGVDLAQRMSEHEAIRFDGVYAHEGHVYQARGQKEIEENCAESARRLLDLAQRIRDSGITCPAVCIGATPTASLYNSETLKELTELHPGSYVYYDAMQTVIGAADKENIALKVVTRIIGHYPHRNQLLIDCGFTAISHEGKGFLDGGSYCYIEGHPELRLKKVHQEVGFVEPKTGEMDYTQLPIGSLLYLLPYHCSSTAVMHEYVWVYTAEGVVSRWQLGARGLW